MEYTTNQKGLISEMEVMLAFIKLGYNVSQPLNADSRYDCILDKNGKLYRIQIKTSHLSTKTNNSIEFKCRSVTTTQNHYKETRYDENEIDYFATYWQNTVYLVPAKECSAQKTLHLIAKPSNPNRTWSYAEDYELSEVIKNL